ncbi:MAG: SRPBCC domain-containing protein [Acidobacteria bacterium]|nr:SRPBCC domain-containing protein [Acidobacteriota bacterium]
MASPSSVAPEGAIRVRRTFAASIEKAFQAWIDPKKMTGWFARGAPSMPPAKIIEADVRTGGRYTVEVECPPVAKDGETKYYRMQGTYREVRPPDKLVFTWWYEGADFEKSLVTVDFRKMGQSNFTEITLTHELLSEKEREGHRKGWEGCFDMLEKTLATE